MTGRVVGPVFGSKNKKDANNRPLDSYIRKQLDMLTKRMKTTGQKFGKGVKRLSDGTVIEFIINLNGPSPVLLARVFSAAAGQASETITEYYMDSGVLCVQSVQDRLDNIFPTETPDLLFQTALTSEINLSFLPDTPALLPLPADEVNNGTPPSFDPPLSAAYKAWEWCITGQQIAARASGKLRLLNQALLGRKVSSPPSMSPVFISSGGSAGPAGAGLLTNADGEYWLAEITNNDVSLTKLQLPENLAALVKDTSGAARLKAEAYALAYAKRSTVTLSTSISGVTIDPDSQPIYWGWAFNWDGSEACLIAHKGTGERISGTPPNEYRLISVETSVYHASFSWDGDSWSVSAALVERVEWLWDSRSTLIWVPAPFLKTLCPWTPTSPVGIGDIKTEVRANDIPVYGFYTVVGALYENTELQYARITDEQSSIGFTNYFFGCGTISYQVQLTTSGWGTFHRERWGGTKRDSAASFGERSVSISQASSISIYLVSSFEATPLTFNSGWVRCNNCNISNTICDPTSTTYVAEVASLPPGGSDGYVFMTDHNYQVTYNRAQGAVTPPHRSNASIFFLFDNCEAIGIAAGRNYYSNDITKTTIALQGATMYKQYGDFKVYFPADGEERVVANYSQYGYTWTQPGIVSSKSSSAPFYFAEAEIKIFDRFKQEIHYSDSIKTESLATYNESDARFFRALSIKVTDPSEDPCLGFVPSLTQGVLPQYRFSFGSIFPKYLMYSGMDVIDNHTASCIGFC
jgi:hypothetical protein